MMKRSWLCLLALVLVLFGMQSMLWAQEQAEDDTLLQEDDSDLIGSEIQESEQEPELVETGDVQEAQDSGQAVEAGQDEAAYEQAIEEEPPAEEERTSEELRAEQEDVEMKLATEDWRNTSESPRSWTAHIAFGGYKLRHIDDEFSNASPAADIFGDDMEFTFQLGFEYLIYQGVGTFGIEPAVGYFRTKGKGLFETTGEQSNDSTTMYMVPLKLSAVYRFTYLWERYQVPLAPYVKFGFDYNLWFVLDNDDHIASYTDSTSGDKHKGYGGTFGMHVSYGLQICLDFIDPSVATEFDQDVGVNNTYLYVEGNYAMINDFWSGSSFDLSDHHFMVGLLFEF